MTDKKEPDYYEILQVSPSADSHTVERVFRHLAKRFHPDNTETANPEARVHYDARHERIPEHQWQVLDQQSAGDDVETDRRIRVGILSLLYATRRQDVRAPGLGTYELERTLGCPEHQMQFHIWYLKENAWIQRLDSGKYAITVSGVDKLVETDIPWRESGQRLLPSRARNPPKEQSKEEAADPGSSGDGSAAQEAQDRP